MTTKKHAYKWLTLGILTGFICTFIAFVGSCQYHHAHKYKSRTGLVDGTTL